MDDIVTTTDESPVTLPEKQIDVLVADSPRPVVIESAATQVVTVEQQTSVVLERSDMSIVVVDGAVGGSGGVSDHGGLSGLSDNDHPQYLLVADIDDTPVNGEVAQPISSNWAFDHVAAADPHPGYLTPAEGDAAYDAIGAAAAAQAASQPLDADLTAIAAANNGSVLAATTASFLTADETKLDGIEAGATADQSAAEILAALLTVDGAGSGLDADLLDGQSSAAFQPVDATLTALAALTIAANTLTIGTGADAFSQTTFAANTFPGRGSTGNLEAKTLSDFALTILDDANAAAVRATIGAGDGSLTVGTTPIGSGTATRLLYEGAGNLLAESANLTFDGTTLTTTGLNNSGNTTLGDASGDTLTINASSGTLPNGISLTRDNTSLSNSFLHAFSATHTNSNASSPSGTTVGVVADAVQNTSGASSALRSVFARARAESTGALSLSSCLTTRVDWNAAANVTLMAGVDSLITLDAAATIGTLAHYYGATVTNGGGASVTNHAVFQANAQTVGSNIFGFRSQIASGSGRRNAYFDGTADNVFQGNTRIGSTAAPTVALDVTGSQIISGDLTVNGNTTIGNASGDSLTLNAGTITINNDFTATHAMGTVPNTANQTPHDLTVTFTSGGASTFVYAWRFDAESQGSTALAGFASFYMDSKHEGSAACDLLLGMQSGARAMSSGDVGVGYAYFGNVAAEGTGDVTIARIFHAQAPFVPSTGRVPTIIGFNAGDLGHASAVDTAIGHDCANFTSGPTLSAAFRSQMTAGTGKFGVYASGTAVNYMKGALGLDVTAPTISSTGLLDMNADTFRLRTSRTPASTGATGNAGEFCWDTGYFYGCTATNSWGRIAWDYTF